MFATGVTRSQIGKPLIGIASSFTDLIPGHADMRSLERFIERGVAAAGGVPFVFGIPGICDGIAMGHFGMRYSLPSRELIADMVESIVRAHSLDGVLLLTNCDKITPGMLMAAVRMDLPAVVLTAGPMITGRLSCPGPSEGKRLDLVQGHFRGLDPVRAPADRAARRCSTWRSTPAPAPARARGFTRPTPWPA